ncbi:hypothetical protein M1271_00980 [Patescibacteria group bacterium]|nr:hypothetical protein [Patescibacteria group bacterium]MCL5798438.1 hypothetical protein [Patescibacteria group bacterium]
MKNDYPIGLDEGAGCFSGLAPDSLGKFTSSGVNKKQIRNFPKIANFLPTPKNPSRYLSFNWYQNLKFELDGIL